MGWRDWLTGKGRNVETPTGGKIEIKKKQINLEFLRYNADTVNTAGLIERVNKSLNPLQQKGQIDSFTIDKDQNRDEGPALVVTVFTDSSRQNLVIAAMKKLEFQGPE